MKENECFSENGINLAITDFSEFHARTLDLSRFSVWTYFTVSLIYIMIWIVVFCFLNKENIS